MKGISATCIRKDLLNQFVKTGNRIKKSDSSTKKTEKVLNLFYKSFYNLLRSFFYKSSDPKHARLKGMASPEVWDQLFLSSQWPKKFIHTREHCLYNLKSLKAQFSGKSCNFLMTQFLCLSTILQEYGKILSEQTEEVLESLFNYKCLDVHKATGNSKYLWTLLIMDMAYLGREAERRQNLEEAYAILSSVLEESKNEEIHHQVVEEKPCALKQCTFMDEDPVSTLDTSPKNEGRFFENNFEIFSPSFLDDQEFEVDYYLTQSEDAYLFN